ncbi:MAG: methyltransferase family protein [Alphaproteobacteria bacterium]
MTAGNRDCPGVIAPPPLIYLGFLGLGLALGYVWPAAVLPGSGQFAAGFALISLGAVIMALAMRRLRRAGTNVEPHKPTTALVTTGPFRLSRNPIYLALSLIHAGIGIAADNPWILGLLVPALAIIRYGVIAREERYLEGKFGAAYLAYKASVRRWL